MRPRVLVLNHWLFKLLPLLGLILLAACNATSETAAISPAIVADAGVTPSPQVTVIVATQPVTADVANSTPEIDQIKQADLAISRTYHLADGNRVVTGRGNLPALTR